LHTFACNSNAGYEYLVASFIAPPCVEALTGFEAQVWVVPPQGVPLPDWWRCEPGGCRDGSLAPSGTSGESCEGLPPGADVYWVTAPQMEHAGVVDGFDVGVIRIVGATAPPGTALVEDQEYTLFKLAINHAHTLTPPCSGCGQPVKLILNWVMLRQAGNTTINCPLVAPPGPARDILLRMTTESVAYWQRDDQWVGMSPVDVPETPASAGLSLSVTSPARGTARVTFGVPRSTCCTLALYDLAGRRLRLLADGIVPAGTRELQWDGRDETGSALPSGYFVLRLVTEQGTLTRSLIHLR
jgi:hypothetical protein